jgi:predicted Rossmann fold nucleotide-binding protein DprA/Smf involved in DNA uptake
MALQPLTSEQKKALAQLRSIAGGAQPDARRHHQTVVARRKAVRALLAREPSTVPRIAAELQIPADEVLWHVTAMRKYGEAAEAGEDDDYILYTLTATDPTDQGQSH